MKPSSSPPLLREAPAAAVKIYTVCKLQGDVDGPYSGLLVSVKLLGREQIIVNFHRKACT